MNLMYDLFQIYCESDEWILVECSISDFLFYFRFSDEWILVHGFILDFLRI